MDLSKYRYRSTFTTTARLALATEQDRFVAKASLIPLRGLLPSDINPADSPDLLYLTCNGAVAGLANKNDDLLTCEAAIAINDTCTNKYISTDHDRDKVVGVVLYPGFSRFGTNEPITTEQAAALQEPFNMSFAGVLWRCINPMLSKYITQNGSDEGSDALSMSWEIAFDSISLAVGSKNIFDARIINADDPQFATYETYLRANKGSGKDLAGNPVYRVIGADSIILGYSVVANPAAEVKGILPIDGALPAEAAAEPASELEQIPESQRGFFNDVAESTLGYDLCDIAMTDGTIHLNTPVLNRRFLPAGITASAIKTITLSHKAEEKNITLSEARVTPNTEKTMKIESIEQLEIALANHEAKVAASDFVKALTKGSDAYIKNLEAKENALKLSEEARAANEKLAKDLEVAIAALRQELTEVRAQAEATASEAKFTDRMSAFDAEFDLDDEDRKLIASDIADLDDEAYAAYMSKCSKLMAGKKKKAKADPMDGDAAKKTKPADKADPDADDDDDDDDDKKDAKAAADMKAAMASVVEDKGQTNLPNSVMTAEGDLKSMLSAAFSDSFKIDGKSLKDKAAKKK